MGVTFGVGTCVFVRSETGQKVIRTAREGIAAVRDAATAPGTRELRDLGCEMAMVMAFERMFDVLKEIAPDAARDARNSDQMPGSGTIVMCLIRPGATNALDCPDVARTYGMAVPGGATRFGVIVQESGSREARCQGTYARDGSFIEPLDTRRRGPSPRPRRPPEDSPVEAP